MKKINAFLIVVALTRSPLIWTKILHHDERFTINHFTKFDISRPSILHASLRIGFNAPNLTKYWSRRTRVPFRSRIRCPFNFPLPVVHWTRPCLRVFAKYTWRFQVVQNFQFDAEMWGSLGKVGRRPSLAENVAISHDHVHFLQSEAGRGKRG